MAANPELVHVLVTPFGADGPRADQPSSELTLAALGGPMSLQGIRERAPVKISVPQVWRQTGAEAALAALVGLTRARRTGAPQWIDVSAQASMTWTMLNAMEADEVQGFDFERAGATLSLAVLIDLKRAAKDGSVMVAPIGVTCGPIVPWLVEEGIVDRRGPTRTGPPTTTASCPASRPDVLRRPPSRARRAVQPLHPPRAPRRRQPVRRDAGAGQLRRGPAPLRAPRRPPLLGGHGAARLVQGRPARRRAADRRRRAARPADGGPGRGRARRRAAGRAPPCPSLRGRTARADGRGPAPRRGEGGRLQLDRGRADHDEGAGRPRRHGGARRDREPARHHEGTGTVQGRRVRPQPVATSTGRSTPPSARSPSTSPPPAAWTSPGG